MNTHVLRYQKLLLKHGFNPGPLDGVRGRLTIRAIKRFQASKNLEVDGLVGPITIGALLNSARAYGPISDVTPWLDEAYRMEGIHETRNLSKLWAWLKSDGASLGDPSKNPWCGDFVQTAIALTMPDEPLPNNPYWARNWAKFGKRCKPVHGAIASFKRGKGGHVGFVVGRDPSRRRLKILGGNQSNAVTEAWISEKRLLATRWPSTALPPDGKAKRASSKGAKLSTNEA